MFLSYMTWLIGLALGASGIVGFALPWLNMFGPVCGGFFCSWSSCPSSPRVPRPARPVLTCRPSAAGAAGFVDVRSVVADAIIDLAGCDGADDHRIARSAVILAGGRGSGQSAPD